MTPGAPAALSTTERKELTMYLARELREGLVAHQQKEARLAEWDRLYQGKPLQQKKSWPWDGAANLVIPMIGTTVDSILARLVNTFFAQDPFWTVQALHADFSALAKPTQDFMEWSRQVEYNLYKPVKRATNECIKYGWAWLKPVWEVETRPYYRPQANGPAKPDPMVLRRPNVYHVLNIDVVTQVGIEDEMQAEWLAQRIRLTDGQMRWRFAEKVFSGDLDNVLRRKADTSTVHEALQGLTDGSDGRTDKLNTVYEVAVEFPLGKDKLPISLVVLFHLESETILRVIYNPSYYGERALTKLTFVDYEGRQESLGICPMLQDLQEEISTVHCQQVDNATLANTRFFVGRRGAVKPGTRIWPGRFLTVSDPERDIKVMQLGDIYPSMARLEQSINAFAERRSGVADYQLGRESQGSSRATATGTLAIIQEGNRRFDLNVRDMRDALSTVGKKVLQLNQQFRPKGLAYFVQGEEDGALTEATLDLPEEYLSHRLGVQLTASTATINREVEKQGLMALLQMLQQNLQLGQQSAAIINNPQAPSAVREYTAKAFEGMTMLMKRVVQTFDQKDVDALIPMLTQEAMSDAGSGGLPPDGAGQIEGPGPGGAPPGAPDGGDGLAGVPGMAS